MKKIITYVSLVSFLIYSFAGCSSSSQTQLPQGKKQVVEFISDHTFNYSKEEVYRASISALQKRNFLITLSDPATGIVNGDYSSSKLLQEEEDAQASDKSSFLTTCLTIVGIVLFIWLIALIFSSDSSSSDDSSSSNYDSDSKVYSYRYYNSLKLTSLSENQTEVSLQLIRMDLENGVVVNQKEVQNSLFNEAFFSLIEKELTISRVK